MIPRREQNIARGRVIIPRGAGKIARGLVNFPRGLKKTVRGWIMQVRGMHTARVLDYSCYMLKIEHKF